MKITDLALIFIAIMLPIIVVVYINVALVTKAEKEEMYYKNLMNAAIIDGVTAMKEIENEDTNIDYGYSGIVDKKVSINAETAINAFYKSLFNNFNISGNKYSEEKLKNYIPAIAVIDYNGIYIYSAEIINNKIVWKMKPKKYFTTSYCIIKSGVDTYKVKNLNAITGADTVVDGLIYEITYSMDDYVVLNTFKNTATAAIPREIENNAFYLTDENNNEYLVQGVPALTGEEAEVKIEVIKYLKEFKNVVLSNIVSNEMTYAINAHNKVARTAGIKYNFHSPYAAEGTKNDVYDTINGIGMIAFIQGVSLGYRTLNYKAYSISELSISQQYYLSTKYIDEPIATPVTYHDKRLYHSSKECPVYKRYIMLHPNPEDRFGLEFVTRKEQAATLGFYACPVCKP